MGDGDPAGVAIPHAYAAGMGGMRTAGDLVARMQMTRAMKTAAAKKYVADKLQVPLEHLTDAVVMQELREDLQIGTVRPFPNQPKGLECKVKIAEILGIEINCLKRLRARLGI